MEISYLFILLQSFSSRSLCLSYDIWNLYSVILLFHPITHSKNSISDRDLILSQSLHIVAPQQRVYTFVRDQLSDLGNLSRSFCFKFSLRANDNSQRQDGRAHVIQERRTPYRLRWLGKISIICGQIKEEVDPVVEQRVAVTGKITVTLRSHRFSSRLDCSDGFLSLL